MGQYVPTWAHHQTFLHPTLSFLYYSLQQLHCLCVLVLSDFGFFTCKPQQRPSKDGFIPFCWGWPDSFCPLSYTVSSHFWSPDTFRNQYLGRLKLTTYYCRYHVKEVSYSTWLHFNGVQRPRSQGDLSEPLTVLDLINLEQSLCSRCYFWIKCCKLLSPWPL